MKTKPEIKTNWMGDLIVEGENYRARLVKLTSGKYELWVREKHTGLRERIATYGEYEKPDTEEIIQEALDWALMWKRWGDW